MEPEFIRKLNLNREEKYNKHIQFGKNVFIIVINNLINQIILVKTLFFLILNSLNLFLL